MGIRSEKSTVRSGHQRRQKSSPVGGGRGSLGSAPPRLEGTRAITPFPPGPWGVRAAPLGLLRCASHQLWATQQSSFRRAGRRRVRRGSSGAPPPKHRAVGGGDRQVASRPLGAGSAVFGGRCAFCFVFILSEVAASAGGQASRAGGSASDTCEEAATACGARALGRAGRAKVQV